MQHGRAAALARGGFPLAPLEVPEMGHIEQQPQRHPGVGVGLVFQQQVDPDFGR